MPERNFENDPRYKLGRSEAIITSAVTSGVVGGISYGITHFLSEGDLDKKVGIGVAGALAPLYYGFFSSVSSNESAERYAIRGRKLLAGLKVVQGVVENTVSWGTSFAIPAYEIGGLEGAVVGGTIGIVLGGVSGIAINSDIRHVSKAYNEVINPARMPRNFPGNRVIPHEQFDNSDPLSDNPPVYRAYTFEDMIGFIQEQSDFVASNSQELSGFFKDPRYSLEKTGDAVFVIPEVKHFEEETAQENLSIKLEDKEGNKLDAKPYTKDHGHIWASPTAFDHPISVTFDLGLWNLARQNSWEHGLVIYAKRNIYYVSNKTTPESLIVKYEYYLMDGIRNNEPGSRRKEDDKKVESRLKRLIPNLAPKSI